MSLKKSSSLKPVRLKNVNIAIVWSRFNESISRALVEGARSALRSSGLPDSCVFDFEVPGAFEIPLAAYKAAQSGKYAGIICLGAVVRGETPHFDYVCRGAAEGIQRAQLDTGIPMAFGVLTTDTLDQALSRSGKKSDNKGFEAAQVVLEMIQLVRSFKKKT